MKRYEVIIWTHNPLLDAFSVLSRIKRTPTIRQYRWRWRARLECVLIQFSPPVLGGFQTASWRPILRVVAKGRAA